MSSGASETIRATHDPTLVARVVRRAELVYEDGGDPAADRARHVRAGSGLAWLEWTGAVRARTAPDETHDEALSGLAELVVAQDDTSFLALLDPATGRARALPLDHVALGRRIFEARLGNKYDKLDLEACTRLPDGRVLVVGSGSLPVRERLVVVSGNGGQRMPAGGDAKIVEAGALYAALRARTDFSGSALNVEGAAVIGDACFLVNRGNGGERDGRRAVDAIAELAVHDLLSYLAGGPVPAIRRVTAFDLGGVDVGGVDGSGASGASVRLTFTDVCPHGGELAFLAAAEASPNVVDDGEVAGAAFGFITADLSTARLGRLLDEHGAPLRAKVEGLAWARPDGTGSRAYAVVDRDDPDLPTELLLLEIGGTRSPLPTTGNH